VAPVQYLEGLKPAFPSGRIGSIHWIFAAPRLPDQHLIRLRRLAPAGLDVALRGGLVGVAAKQLDALDGLAGQSAG